MTSHRNTFTFIFTATLAAVFLIVTGLIGYRPPAHLSLDADTWRHGTWADGIIFSQVVPGIILLVIAGVVAFRVNYTAKGTTH